MYEYNLHLQKIHYIHVRINNNKTVLLIDI